MIATVIRSTGLTGSLLVRQLLADPEITRREGEVETKPRDSECGA